MTPTNEAAEWHRYLHAEGVLVPDEGEECGPWHHRVFLSAPSLLQERPSAIQSQPMTDRREEPATAAGRRLLGSILVALQQEGADVADLSWVDQIADVEREALPAPLDVERAAARLLEWAEGMWDGSGCVFCHFSEGHDSDCLVDEAIAEAGARLSAQPTTEPAQGGSE